MQWLTMLVAVVSLIWETGAWATMPAGKQPFFLPLPDIGEEGTLNTEPPEAVA